MTFDKKIQFRLSVEGLLLGLVIILLDSDTLGFRQRRGAVELTLPSIGLLERLFVLTHRRLDLLLELIVLEFDKRLIFLDLLAMLDQNRFDLAIGMRKDLPFNRRLQLAISLQIEIHRDQEHR